MDWKCPECGASVDNARSECDCGYAFYKVLGVKPDATAADVEKAYRYLRKVWQSDRVTQDPVAQQKARARMEQIEKAYLLYRSRTTPEGPARKGSAVKIAGISALFLLCIVIALIYFGGGNKKQPPVPEQTSSSAPAQTGPQTPQTSPAVNAAREEPAAEPSPAETEVSLPDDEDSGQRAVDLVKKSHVLDRVFPVEAVVRNWSETDAGKMQVIGWQSKKMGEQVYIVSYTATDGLNTKGFYFEVNLDTGVVRDVAKHPELQQKYGIRYR